MSLIIDERVSGGRPQRPVTATTRPRGLSRGVKRALRGLRMEGVSWGFTRDGVSWGLLPRDGVSWGFTRDGVSWGFAADGVSWG